MIEFSGLADAFDAYQEAESTADCARMANIDADDLESFAAAAVNDLRGRRTADVETAEFHATLLIVGVLIGATSVRQVREAAA